MLHEWGVGYLAREAQQQAQRERAGRGKAKAGEVADRVHDQTIARRTADWQRGRQLKLIQRFMRPLSVSLPRSGQRALS